MADIVLDVNGTETTYTGVKTIIAPKSGGGTVEFSTDAAKPAYLIHDGDSISELFFNGDYVPDTFLAGLTYADTDPETGLDVCALGLGYLFAVDLTSGNYAIVWNDGVNIVPIYSTVAVPAFGVTVPGWQILNYQPVAAISVDVSDIIEDFYAIMDNVVAKEDVAFGHGSAPYLCVREGKITASGVKMNQSATTVTVSSLPHPAGDYITKIVLGHLRAVGSANLNISNSNYIEIPLENVTITAGTTYDSLSYTDPVPSGQESVTTTCNVSLRMLVYYRVPNCYVTINKDGSYDYVKTADVPSGFLQVGSNVLRDGNAFFQELYPLRKAKLKSGVTAAHKSMFENKKTLVEVVLPSSLTTIENQAFCNCGISALTIPSGVTQIGSSAFSGCSSLESVNIPSGITSISDNVFLNCESLQSIELPSGLTSIGIKSFSGTGLTSIDIPAGVTSIGKGAFEYCTSLTSFICRATTPPTLGTDVFYSVPISCTIYVPAASVDTYKAAQYWSSRAAHIQAIPE